MSICVQAKTPAHGCLSSHLEEAIALNLHRKPMYAAATGGASLAISNRLIFLERTMLLAEWFKKLDQKARVYQNAGIPLFCDEFVSMSETPEFVSFASNATAPLQKFDALVVSRNLKAVLKKSGIGAFKNAAMVQLKRLELEPEFHCMSRHMLESAIRAANLTPLHAEKATALGLPSTLELSREFIVGHLSTMAFAYEIDSLAMPLQIRGVPIICRDVPAIPLY